MITLTSKSSCNGTLFGNQHIYEIQTFLKLERHHYYPVFPWIGDIVSFKKSELVWSDILRQFVNTLTADNKYSNGNMQNFAKHIQTQLCLKQKTFSGFFIAFLKCAWNLKQFETKDVYPSSIIYQIIDAERSSF